MPSLNNLRTKGGVIVTIVIFLALIAFLIGDLFLGGSSILNSRKMRVGKISGKNIDYTEFYNETERIGAIYKLMWGRDATGSQEQELIYNTAWEQMVMKYSYAPSFEKMGLIVSDAEQLDMVDGVYLSPVMTQNFSNPNTGIFDPAMMRDFMSSASSDDYAYAIWNFLKEQMLDERIMSKYLTLVTNGFNVTNFEVDYALQNAGASYDASVVGKNYFSVADSLVNVSSSDIRDYYNKHKESFKQSDSRDVEYVLFDVIPSADDYAKGEEEINKIATDFAVSETPMQYAVLNSQDKPDENYYSEDKLTPQLAAIAFGSNVGQMYGPVLNGDTYSVSRMTDAKMIPDSLGAKHILLMPGQNELADSLVRVLRSGSNFETLAREYSLDQSVQFNGGDIGRFTPEQMVPQFSDAVIAANVRDIVKAESQFGLHIIQVTYKSRPVRKVQIATITYKVDPSGTTMKNIYAQASAFKTAAGDNVDGFKQAVTDEALSKRSVRIRNTDRTLSGLENSKELIRWAFNNKKGAVSGIMEIDGDYLVAALTDVKEEGYASVEDTQVHTQIKDVLLNEAKAKYISNQMQGSDINAVASAIGEEVKDVEGIEYNGFFIPDVGMEPALLGALSAANQGVISKPVKGYSGVYRFVINNVSKDAAVTADTERARLEANTEMYLDQRAAQALYEESDITDMRVKFF